jgi:hypothetical protein
MGFGVVNSMKKSLKANKSLLGKRKSLKDLRAENGGFSSGHLKFKEPTAAELSSFKRRNEIRLKKEKVQGVILVVFTILLTAALIYTVFTFKV